MALDSVNSFVDALLFPGTVQFCFQLSEFCRFLPFVLLLTPMQCLSEELVFRGYVLQGTAPLVRNAWLLAGLNGFLFMLPHLWNPGVQDDFIVMALYYFSVGFLLAILTIRTNSLELAIGTHVGTNLSCALVTNYAKSPFHTSPILMCTQMMPKYELAAFIVFGLILYWLVVKFICPSDDK